MTKAMEKYPKRGRSAGRFTGNGRDAHSKVGNTSSVMREKPLYGDRAEKKKEGTTMTKEKRFGFLTLLQSVMSHPYGVVFNDIEMLRECRYESFKKFAKPIDLETVKSTLENNLYFTVEAFAEDVRTTFSNAMQIFPATNDVHKMAAKLSELFESGFKIKVESLNPEQKTCNATDVSEKKETQGEKTDSSSRKRKSAAASSGREKIYVGQQNTDRKDNRVFVTGTHLVKGRDGKSFDITVVSSATKKSPVAISPRRAARITALMERFSGTIKKAEKEFSPSAPIDNDRKKEEKGKRETDAKLKVKEHDLYLTVSKDSTSQLAKGRAGKKEAHSKVPSASAPTDSDRKREARLKVKEQSKREREAQLKEQRKREREALERMENTAQFGADYEALKEFEWLLAHPELTTTGNSRRLAESIGEEVGMEEMEEGEIPPYPRALEILD